MSGVVHLLHQARAARDEARRARRLAGSLTQVDDRNCLLRYADGEDLRAAGMEQQASASLHEIQRTQLGKR